MSPVIDLEGQGLWLPILGWFSKGRKGQPKSPYLILPEPLAKRLGRTEVTELMVRWPYDAIGLPDEILWPYTNPHVFPTNYRLQVPRGKKAGALRRPTVCMGDGQHVCMRKPNMVQSPGFDQQVFWGDPPTLFCKRQEHGHDDPCPFSVPKKAGANPQCILTGFLHILVPVPSEEEGRVRVEAGVYILEVPRTKISEVMAQLQVLKEIGGGRLVGHTYLLRWEQARGWRMGEEGRPAQTRFFSPMFELFIPSELRTEDQEQIDTEVEAEAPVAVAASLVDSLREIGVPEPDQVVQKCGVERVQSVLAQAQQDTDQIENLAAWIVAALQKKQEGAVGKEVKDKVSPDLLAWRKKLQQGVPRYKGRGRDALGTSNPNQRTAVRDMFEGHDLNTCAVLLVLWGVRVEDLSGVQAATLIRWGQLATADEWGHLKKEFGSGLEEAGSPQEQ